MTTRDLPPGIEPFPEWERWQRETANWQEDVRVAAGNALIAKTFEMLAEANESLSVLAHAYTTSEQGAQNAIRSAKMIAFAARAAAPAEEES